MTSKGVSGKEASTALAQAGIVTNANAVPFDPRKPFDPSGVRIGTPAATTRGWARAHGGDRALVRRSRGRGAQRRDELLARVKAEVRI